MRDKKMADDWDLNAVVQSCNNRQMNSNNYNHLQHKNTCLSSFYVPTTLQTQNDNHFPMTHYYNHLSGPQYLVHEPPQFIYQNNLTHTTTINNIIVTPNINNNNSQFLNFSGFSDQPYKSQLQNTVVLVPRPIPHGYSQMAHNLRAVQNNNIQMPPKPKPPKKKDSVKKTICVVTKENLNTDVWSWRKYGRKPIKGSRYPRNYYRCSSNGCLARKQMERSCNEPDLYILTLTGEHSHALPTKHNPLAGTTRAPEEDDVTDTASSSTSSSPPSVPDIDVMDSDDMNFDVFDHVFLNKSSSNYLL